jgi:hypothetical protein
VSRTATRDPDPFEAAAGTPVALSPQVKLASSANGPPGSHAVDTRLVAVGEVADRPHHPFRFRLRDRHVSVGGGHGETLRPVLVGFDDAHAEFVEQRALRAVDRLEELRFGVGFDELGRVDKADADDVGQCLLSARQRGRRGSTRPRHLGVDQHEQSPGRLNGRRHRLPGDVTFPNPVAHDPLLARVRRREAGRHDMIGLLATGAHPCARTPNVPAAVPCA